jgi:SAM-dependent methyltransferase
MWSAHPHEFMAILGTLENEKSPLIPRLESQVLPHGLELVPGLNSIYELELALAEARALTRNELVERSAYFARVDGRETNHYVLCSQGPLQVGKASFRLRAFFEVYRFKTSYATHGLFPYRGKFHPQLIKAIMNIIAVRPGETILDPMTGSGTTNIEASLIGIDSIGIDASPFAKFMASTKSEALAMTETEFETIQAQAESVHDLLSNGGFQETLINHETGRVSHNGVHPLLLLAYLDAMGYATRVKTKKLPELVPVVMKRYVAAVLGFIRARERLGLRLGRSSIQQGDARTLSGIPSGSIDGVITSPPYSFAIDYLKGDKSQLDFLGYDSASIRERMIGLRGSGLKNQVLGYLSDMERVLGEMSRVLKPNKYAVIVIGSNTVQLEKIEEAVGLRLEDRLVELSSKNGLRLAQRFQRPIEGVQNVMKSEHILFLRKQ